MSSNLGAPALVGGQANPETTSNDAVGRLDAAMTEKLVVDLTNNVVLTTAQYQSSFWFSVTPAGVAKTLTLPAVKRLVWITNGGANSISVVKGSTSIALGVGGSAFYYTDGTANGLLQVDVTGTKAFDIGVFIPGKPTAGQIVLRFSAVRAFNLPASLTGSVFSSGVASAANVVFTIKKNGASIGTIAFSTSSTGVPTFASAVSFAINDLLTIEAPAVADTTMQDIALDFLGTR